MCACAPASLAPESATAAIANHAAPHSADLAIADSRRRRSAKNSAAPTTFRPITTAEIFIAKLSQLVTSMIGKIDSTTYNSVTANPDTDATRSHSGKRASVSAKRDDGNREQHEIRQPVEDARGVVEQLKRFLLADAGDARRAEHQRHEPDEENRIHRRPVLRMERA